MNISELIFEIYCEVIENLSNLNDELSQNKIITKKIIFPQKKSKEICKRIRSMFFV